MEKLTHVDDEGRAKMVDVGSKIPQRRCAVARGTINLSAQTLSLIKDNQIRKGDVLTVAKVAGIMGAKRTPDLIPMCHPLLLTGVDVNFTEEAQPDASGRCCLTIEVTVKTTGNTGVEMEAMTAVSVAALTIYDMCKAVDKGMAFGDICLMSKSGGKSGTYERPPLVG